MKRKNRDTIKAVLVPETITVKNALKALDRTAQKVLLVVDDNERLLGALSDGDIRRYVLGGGSLEKTITGIYNNRPSSLKEGQESKATAILIKKKIDLLPILDADHKVVSFITWPEMMSQSGVKQKKKKGEPAFEEPPLTVPVVIMAGGKGTRLSPFTKILPKPLIPLGDKPIVEIIINEFGQFGIDKYFLTLNYKGELIESYFNNIEKDYTVECVWEKEFLGTAGSLKILADRLDDVFIVSNCDVIVKADYREVLKFHAEKNAALTVLSSIQHYKIPYGVVDFGDGGLITKIREKPEYTYTVNTGAYVINREALDLIPTSGPFDMPDLIQALMAKGRKVFTYPVNEKEYIDIGQWKEYRSALDHFENLWGSN